MKKALLFIGLLLLLLAGAWVGEKMIQDSGYVLVAYKQTTIETSLWVLLVIAALLFIVSHWLVNLIFHPPIPTASIRTWKEHRNQRISRRKTLKGLTSLSEGNWAQAQRQLASAAERSDLPLINYLAAARAAHEQNNDSATDELLHKARSSTPEAEVTVAISQAEIQLSRGQLEPCLATLLRLRTLAPKNTYVMKLLKDIYIRLNDWPALAELLPIMKKHQALKHELQSQLEQRCYSNLLEQSISSLPVETSDEDRLKLLGRTWSNIPQEQARNSDLVKRYTEQLVELGAEDRAEQLLRDLIKRSWDEKLVSLYGRLKGENIKKQLDHAKAWLKEQPESAALHLTLGRLSMRNQYWGQALKYFDRSMEITPSSEALAEQARLLRHLGDQDKAQNLLQQNLDLISSELPELPMPEKSTA